MSVVVNTKDLPLNLAERVKKLCKKIKGLQKTEGLIKIKQVADYLYEAWYSYTDDDHARDILSKNAPVSFGGGCSAVRNGDFFGRNYDWLYTDEPEVLVHTEDSADHFAVVGMCRYHKDSGVIPYLMTDGINEYGIAACMNVVPSEGKDNEITAEYPEETVNALTLVYRILSKFKNTHEAKYWVEESINIFFPKTLHDMGYEIHLMIVDENGYGYVIEFVDNTVVTKEVDSAPYMTNFLLDGVTFNNDGTVYTPYTQDETHNAVDTNGVTEHGSGLERYNLIVNGYENADTKGGMVALMSELAYSKTYDELRDTPEADIWYSEFVEGDTLTAKTPYTEFGDALTAAREKYYEEHSVERAKGNKTWMTLHCSIYDLVNRTITVILDEDYANVEYNSFNTAVRSYKMLEARIEALEDAE